MNLRRSLAWLSLAALLASALPYRPASAVEPGSEHMLAHRAAYRLKLDSVRDSASIEQAEGIMLFEVIDACDAWASRQRFTLLVSDRDGNVVETTSDYATLEAKDGSSLRFSLTQTTGGAVTSRVAGDASITATGGRIRYQEPAATEEDLPEGTILPMIHTLRSLAAARAGQRIFVAPLFDGTSADGAQDTTTIISGGWIAPQPNPNFPLLATLSSARMRIAFFDRNASGQGGGASTPEYEVSMRYFENGVADEMKMDFGEFVVDGRLGELQPIPSPC
ncbi:DUF1849 family protein [Sediminicoccus sp. KRV36]|uniref:EipB family protein n=1 Tax=Sediminicoccus sp. KRV36 TaxID=3133721 RepID=UPI00200F2229|nr:DUF1849 family protein [Sediminicoccus rosea]UPY36103.1 cell envelope integrity EipB family protein [Sediminicoccus rosea]